MMKSSSPACVEHSAADMTCSGCGEAAARDMCPSGFLRAYSCPCGFRVLTAGKPPELEHLVVEA
jgi:DNA-directed RNA polymerase subunit RPC12/RpoP